MDIFQLQLKVREIELRIEDADRKIKALRDCNIPRAEYHLDDARAKGNSI
jgi:hypothetical protein